MLYCQYVRCGRQRVHRAVRDDEAGQVNLLHDEQRQRSESAFKPQRASAHHLPRHGPRLRRWGQNIFWTLDFVYQLFISM